MEFTLDVSEWLPYVSVALPVVIGFFVKSSLSERAKAAVMLVATALVTLVNQVTESAGILTGESFQIWLFATITTIATYYGVWKPIGLGNVKPAVGIGPSEPPPYEG